MTDVWCPYCDQPQDINHDDGYGFGEDEVYQQHCRDCDKVFTYTTAILYVYNAEKAECLNGGDHTFEKTWTNPVEYTKMRCTQCDEQRQPTVEEMAAIMEDWNENRKPHTASV